MAVLAMAYGIVIQHSIWYPINLMAAAGVPSLANADLATLRQFSAAGLTVAILSHLAFSILVGLLYTVLLPMLPAAAGMAIRRSNDASDLDCLDLPDV